MPYYSYYWWLCLITDSFSSFVFHFTVFEHYFTFWVIIFDVETFILELLSMSLMNLKVSSINQCISSHIRGFVLGLFRGSTRVRSIICKLNSSSCPSLRVRDEGCSSKVHKGLERDVTWRVRVAGPFPSRWVWNTRPLCSGHAEESTKKGQSFLPLKLRHYFIPLRSAIF